MTRLFPTLFLFPALAFAEWVVYEKEMADSEWQKRYVLESGRPEPAPDASCVIRLWGHTQRQDRGYGTRRGHGVPVRGGQPGAGGP